MKTLDFQGFYGSYLRFAKSGLHSHLLCYFSRKVFLLFLDSLSGLVTNKSLDGNVGSVCLCHLCYVLAYRLFSVFCLYVHLIQKTDFLELFLNAAWIIPWITFSGF